jgi:hypothetical protein
VFVTDFFAPRYSQWKIFVGVLFLLLIFHMAVSFFFGRLPTSPMLSGMAVEYAEKKKLGVLLVMHFFASLPLHQAPAYLLLTHPSSLSLFSCSLWKN